MLTEKQEKYVQELLKGKSQREAYKTAYPNSRKWKDNSVDCRASKLLKNAKVMQRYKQLREEIEEEHKAKHLWDKEQATKGLLWIIKESQNSIKEFGIRHANSTAFLTALKELNELEGVGLERETKVELNKARVDKIYSEIKSTESTENKLKEYFKVLGESLDE